MKHISANLFTPKIISIILFLLIYSPNTFSQSLTAEQIYKKVSNAVVVVHAYDENNRLASQGSGVVLNDKGYVVTNYHVLSGNDRLEILHGKEVVPYVDIIGIDVEKDILILKIDAKKFPSVKVGDSKNLNIGQRVYAIGSPMGLENSISEGIISGLRSVDELQRNFIQITASISPGSSGGAVVNNKGELIGISTLTAKEGQNLNFAIPIDDVLNVEISSYSKNNAYKNFELFFKGSEAIDKNDYSAAIRYFSLYIQKYPNNEVAHYNLGISKVRLKNYQSAIQDFNKAVELNPNFTDAYINRGIAKYYFEDYKGAIQDYSKAIEINPNIVEAYCNRGIAKYNLEDYEGAVQDCNKAIEINPDIADAYYNRGNAKLGLADKNGACLDWNKSLELGYTKASDLIIKYCQNKLFNSEFINTKLSEINILKRDISQIERTIFENYGSGHADVTMCAESRLRCDILYAKFDHIRDLMAIKSLIDKEKLDSYNQATNKKLKEIMVKDINWVLENLENVFSFIQSINLRYKVRALINIAKDVVNEIESL
ncbi:MAG: TPR repeat-containing protein [Stygiobacter sp.]|nr:MAG: TPR repeat-containing protein [Stygiobacter sp.]KAF0217817.1 MAG: TPR repeat-containing [Ignavibacteria bacterium]